MSNYIDKDALVAELEKRLEAISKASTGDNRELAAIRGAQQYEIIKLILYIDTLKVKEMVEYKQPEYSCLKTIYQCGKKPHWDIGDTLAYYEFYSDREGEFILGKITKVDFNEEQCDWSYTFEDGSLYYEQSLLEEQTYKKN